MIEANALTKTYGERVAVSDLSFEVKPGEVTGFLGPNGAGKSTTMRLVLGLDAPTSGHAPEEWRRRAGGHRRSMGETTTDPLETARAGRELVDDWSSADVDWFALGCRIGYRKGIHVDVVPTDETLLPGGDRMPPYGEMWGNTSLLVELREAQQEVILRARYPLPDWREVVTPGGSLTRALLAVRDRLVEFEVTIDPGSGLGHAREVVDTHLRYDTQAVFAHRYDPRAWPSSWE